MAKMKLSINIILIYSYINLICCLNEKYITIPFYIDYIQTSSNISDEKKVIEKLDDLHAYANIQIGKPKQYIKMTINSKNYFMYMLDSKLNNDKIKGYNTSSETCRFFSDLSIKIEEVSNLMEFCDYIDLSPDIKDQNLFYLPLGRQIDNNKIYKYKNGGYIGLSGNSNRVYDKFNILVLLKARGYIQSYDFFFNYTSNNSGNIIIGTLPFNVLPNTTEKDYFEIKEEILYKNINWNCIIHFITICNTKLEYLNNDLIYHINFEDYLFTAPKSFLNKFKSNFFQEYINNKECFEYIYNDYIYLYCNKYNVDFTMINNIEFETRLKYPLKTVYSFNDTELFYEYGDYKYFLIRFYNTDTESNKHWSFGQLFLKKYIIAYNQDKKIMYIKINNRKDIPINKRVGVIVYIIIILIILVIILGIYLGKILYDKYQNKKAVRYATELSEERLYDNILNINNK